jgi:hypothetical protein
MSEGDKIVVVTTQPQYYKHCSFVTVISINNDQIEEWQGKHHFFWRAKIKAIESVRNMYPDHDLLYLDCDTFLYGSLQSIREAFDANHGLMDADDGHPSQMKTKTLRMWKTVGGRTYDGITLGMQHHMWVAGVVGIPKKLSKEIISTALHICDGMLDDNAERIVIEQYALSISLFEKTKLIETKHWIGHYWKNKEAWIGIASKMMLKSFLSDGNIDDELKSLESLPFSTTPTYVDYSNTSRRLQKLVGKIFPNKGEKYINKDVVI